MASGFLTVQTTTGGQILPIEGATVTVKDNNGQVIAQGRTDAGGNSQVFELYAPPAAYSLDPRFGTSAYATYNVEAAASGFVPVQVNGVRVVAGSSVLPVDMRPSPADTRGVTAPDIYIITPPSAAMETGRQLQDADTPDFSAGGTALAPQYDSPQEDAGGAVRGLSSVRKLSSPSSVPNTRLSGPVCIPDKVRVHLGTPSNSGAQNVTVSFKDYIKNVISSEIYSTWPTNAIIANIHAVVTFTLNRIYTEWYPSRGYNFDITSNTAYDQKYTPGINIPQNVSDLVDQYYNVFVRRIGFQNPYFTEYCNGTTTTCNGLSQWGTVPLAQQGLTPLQILQRYYGNDIELATANCTQGTGPSYPGSALRVGSTGDDVRRIQNFLNRIRADYPAIPQITNPNGYYGTDTANAVRAFQQIFHVGIPDGIVGQATWNKITQIYTGITKISELNGEGERVGLSPNPPTSTVSQGARGENVAHLQFILSVLSNYYSDIPVFIRDSSFGPATKNAVIAFQKMAGLTPDGVVGPATWQALYRYYRGVINTTPPAATTPPTTGTDIPAYQGPFREGDSGTLVRAVQNYLNDVRLDYPNIPYVEPDGVFGPATRRAVIAFQQQFGLGADGIVGAQTWNRLVQEYLIESGGVGQEPTEPQTPIEIEPTNPNQPTVYPGTPLRSGSRGTSVRIIQECLGIGADGVFGALTESAVRSFQRSHGLVIDGIVGPQTWNAIIAACGTITQPALPETPAAPYPGTPLRQGSRGENVRLIQQRLGVTPADGIFGPQTYNAVVAFQRSKGLTADGIVGVNTWNAIMNN